MSVLEILATFFAPDSCLICGHEGSLLCGNCLHHLPSLKGICFSCGKIVERDVSCQNCCWDSGYNSLNAVTDYSAVSQVLIKKLKFHSSRAAAKVMARVMVDSINDCSWDVITNVPATTSHIRQRGYDQAALIAKEMSRLLRVPYTPLLRRTGWAHQLGSGRRQRLSQMQTAIALLGNKNINNLSVLVIDDVLTTGSSLRVAAEQLRQAGVERLDGMVFAQSLNKKNYQG